MRGQNLDRKEHRQTELTYLCLALDALGAGQGGLVAPLLLLRRLVHVRIVGAGRVGGVDTLGPLEAAGGGVTGGQG